MIDFQKFAALSRPGPRYTSYPTAPEFHEGFTEVHYLKELRAQSSQRPISLYLHLPFCRSACYFCGCNTLYTTKESHKQRYIEVLERELEILGSALDCSREVVQLHLGGGTPTYYDGESLSRIIALLRARFPNFSQDAEIGCEIDPRFFDAEHMEALRAGGFNRLSFGVQDFDRRVQEAVHRIQDVTLVRSAVERARSAGISSLNFDLIYGLPHQGVESFSRTLDEVISLSPDRLAVFNYAHVPWMKKTMRKIDETTLPDPEVKLKTLEHTICRLLDAGFVMIGMDHFAKPEDPLAQAVREGSLHRNFQGYTTHKGADLIGIGLTSIGEGEGYYVQYFKELAAYEEAIAAGRLPVFRGIALTPDDRIRQAVIMELMSNFTLDIPRMELEKGVVFADYFAEELRELERFEAQGLLTLSSSKIEIIDTGKLLVRNLVMPFDARLNRVKEEERRFSKTV